MADHDVVVVGGGHNGLVCGLVLARAGLDVLIVEQASAPGGCVWTETLVSGHRLERGAVDHSMVVSVAEELGLADHGLEYQFRNQTVGAGFGDGRSIVFDKDLDTSLAAVDRFASGDVDDYRRLSEIGGRLFGLLDSFSDPPSLGEVLQLAGQLPGDIDLGRLLVSSSESVVGQFLDDPHLRSVLTMYGSHSQLPSFLPGTGLFAFLLPQSHGSNVGRPIGGSVSLISALVSAFEAAGGEIRVGTRVREIRSAPGGAVVATASEEFSTRHVVSSVDVRRTVDLLEQVPRGLGRAAMAARSGAMNVGELKVDLALSSEATVGFQGGDEAIWMLQEHPGSLRRNFASILLGRMPESTALMWASPSALDPSAAPPGEGSAWLSVFVPAQREDGVWDESTEEVAADWVLAGFERVTGVDVRSQIRAMRVSSPRLWEERTGNPGGNPNHLDLTLDQSFSWRPPTSHGFRTELPFLFLTGAGTHPGGGLSGLPGKGAAAAVLEDLDGGRRKTVVATEVRALWRSFQLYRSLRRNS